MDLLERAKQKLEESKKVRLIESDKHDKKVIPGEDDQKVEPSQLSKKVSKPKKTPKKILGDKILNKDQMIQWLKEYIEKNQNNFTLDWLRGQRLTFESVNEMRK